MPCSSKRTHFRNATGLKTTFSPISSLTRLLLVLLLPAALAHSSHLYLNVLDTNIGASSQKASSTQEGVRPHPSDKLPIEDLVENPDNTLDPTPEDLNTTILLRRLGSQLDTAFFSIKEPKDINGTFVYDLESARAKKRRPDFLKYLRTFELANGQQVKLKAGKKQRRRLQKMVWNFTYCPVQYIWKDLGIRFWPRWLREGVCWNGRPCSLPPGMTCKPTDSVRKSMLRWHCRTVRPRVRPVCRWIVILYPVITQCACMC